MGAAIAGVTTFDPSLGHANRQPKSELDAEAFLQLLVAQLRYQDPLDGMDQTAFMQQLATMSNVQAQQSTNDMLNSLVGAQQLVQATALIGHQVSGLVSNQPVSGKVDSVSVVDGVATLNLGALKLPFWSVTAVQ